MASVVVIGAGAAGISVARELVAGGATGTIFEARNRIGGRAHTDHSIASHPVELGAEFIHGESVATWDWIRELNAATTGDAHSYAKWFVRDGRLLDGDAYREAVGAELYGALARLGREWVDAGRPDASLDRLLEGWEERFGVPLGVEERAMIANITAQGSSSDLGELSIYRREEATYEGDGRLQHWRLLEGYARLMHDAAAGLDIRLESPVTRIRWDERSVQVHASGSAHRYDRAVVTLPLGVLQRGGIEFDPELPPEKRDAIARLVPGHINKVVLRLDRVRWPPDLTFLFAPHDTQLWWRPGQGQPHEDPVLTAFFGGSDAESFESMSEAEAIEEATRQLADILGDPETLSPAKSESGWCGRSLIAHSLSVAQAGRTLAKCRTSGVPEASRVASRSRSTRRDTNRPCLGWSGVAGSHHEASRS